MIPELPEGTLLGVTLIAMLIGLVGSVVPGLPGVTLIFVSGLVYAYLTGFEEVGATVVILLGVFAALAFAADFVGTSYGARRFGASNWGTVGGAVGGLVGTLLGALVFGVGAIIGLIAGSIAGVFAGEYFRRHRQPQPENEGSPIPRPTDWRRASRAAGGVLVGYVISAVAQGILGLASVGIFVLSVVD